MDDKEWHEIITHELFILFWLSDIHFLIIAFMSLLEIKDTILWISLLMTIFGSIIQDHNTYPETPSVYIQSIRMATNVIVLFCAILTPSMICETDDDSLDLMLPQEGRQVKFDCHYDTIGKITLLFAMSIIIVSLARTIVIGLHLLWKTAHLLWEHFNEDID